MQIRKKERGFYAETQAWPRRKADATDDSNIANQRPLTKEWTILGT